MKICLPCSRPRDDRFSPAFKLKNGERFEKNYFFREFSFMMSIMTAITAMVTTQPNTGKS